MNEKHILEIIFGKSMLNASAVVFIMLFLTLILSAILGEVMFVTIYNFVVICACSIVSILAVYKLIKYFLMKGGFGRVRK